MTETHENRQDFLILFLRCTLGKSTETMPLCIRRSSSGYQKVKLTTSTKSQFFPSGSRFKEKQSRRSYVFDHKFSNKNKHQQKRGMKKNKKKAYQIDLSLVLVPFMGRFFVVDETLHDHRLLLVGMVAEHESKKKDERRTNHVSFFKVCLLKN